MAEIGEAVPAFSAACVGGFGAFCAQTAGLWITCEQLTEGDRFSGISQVSQRTVFEKADPAPAESG